jgi:O-antigen/teichoic acid export membrane protein
MMNLLEPAFHLQVSLAMILIPSLVRARETVAFRRLAGLTLAACLSSAVAYSLTLVFFQDWIVAWLYDGQYGEYAHLLWLLALLPLAGAVGVTVSSVLRALERPNHVFWAQLVSTVLTLTVGLALLAWWGISGAAVGFLINWAVSPAIMAVLLSSRRVASQAVPTGGGAR